MSVIILLGIQFEYETLILHREEGGGVRKGREGESVGRKDNEVIEAKFR